MATYGFSPVGSVPFTGYTNTLGVGPANTDVTNGSVYFNGFTQGDDRIAKMLRNGGKGLVLREVMSILLTSGTGVPVVKTKKQVQGVTGGFGGVAPIETVTLINRNSTASDVIAITSLLYRNPFPTNYAADVSGNGGGGKQQVGGGAF